MFVRIFGMFFIIGDECMLKDAKDEVKQAQSLIPYRLGRDRGAVDDAARNIPQRKQEYEEEQPQKRKPRRRFFHMGIFDGGFHRGLDGQRFFTLRDGGVGFWEGGGIFGKEPIARWPFASSTKV